jgi:outer membrane protein TolC
MREPRAVQIKTRWAIPEKIAAILFLLAPLTAGAQISLSTAVDLAEKNSPAVHAALANIRKATAALQEAKDAYIPNFVLGISPGYAYGFPLGYPSFFNANASSLVLSWSQKDYIRAAREGVNSASLNLKNVQQEVALDVALDYVELDHDLKEIAALEEETSFVGSLVQIEQERVQAGVDPRRSQLEAELTAAQVDEKRIQLENDADTMRQKLAHLTGLPGVGLTTVSSSIPPAPAADSFATIDKQTAQNNPAVSAAYADAKSKWYAALGDKKQNYRPLAAFGAQYSLFEKTPGYTEYFPHFQYNNVELGVQLTFPLFDATRRAKARESSADAAHAGADADAALNILSEQTAAMRGSLRELGAQQRVAQVESEIAQVDLESVKTELTSGTGAPNSGPVTPTQAQRAHIEERQRYEEVLDSNFSLIKVELNLLRVTGQLDAWVRSSLTQTGP